MLAFLPSPILLVLNCILLPLNSILIATPIMLLGAVRFILPFRPVILLVERLNYHLYKTCIRGYNLIIRLTNDITWHITGDEIPAIPNSCIVVSNHMSWADILILWCVYRDRLPTTKFFMKWSLLFIPFIGLACYAMGMPFLHRYSKAQLLHNPQLRSKDIESTKSACRRLALWPSTLINFMEGTRHTPPKAFEAKSPYRHLMPPKAISLAVTLGEIGDKADILLNTTLCYPRNRWPNKPFIDMLKGRMKDVCAHIEVMRVGEDLRGDYIKDKAYKRSFTVRMRELWQEKDSRLESMLAQFGVKEDYSYEAMKGRQSPSSAAEIAGTAQGDGGEGK